MRFTFVLVALISPAAFSAELDAKLLRLIGSDATSVVGVDLERFEESRLSYFFPDKGPAEFGNNKPRRYVWVDYSNSSMTIYQGNTSVLNTKDLRRRYKEFGSEEPDGPKLQAGDVIDLAPKMNVVVLDAQTAIFGDSAILDAAVTRWNRAASADKLPIPDALAKIRDLSASFDNWFYLIRPLAKLKEPQAAFVGRYRSELFEAIEDVKGGMRVGAVNEFYVEARTRRFEDAQTLAGIARWIPAFLQDKPDEGRVVDAMEGLDARASGSIASLAFTISNQSLQKMMDEDETRAKSAGPRFEVR